MTASIDPVGHNRDTEDTETLRQRESETWRLRDAKDPYDTDDQTLSRSLLSFQDVVKACLPFGTSLDAMFHLARALKGFERNTGRSLTAKERGAALALWWTTAPIEDEADFAQYAARLSAMWSVAKTPMGANPLLLANAAVEALPENPTFEDRIVRLIAVCRKLASDSADGEFFISYRSAAKVIGSKDPYAARDALALIIERKILRVSVRYTKNKANRYRFVSPLTRPS